MRLLAYKVISGIITLKSGLRIGASRDQMSIGDVDNPVIRNPLTNQPYIPGSSIKGKLRSLLEWSLGGNYIAKSGDHQVFSSDDPNDPIARMFGVAPGNDARSAEKARLRGPTRLLVRDSYLTAESMQKLAQMNSRGGFYTEIKQEVFIPRIGGNANPRSAERIPAGAQFDFEVVYRVFDLGDGGSADQKNFTLIEKGLTLLQLDGLGGYISRGYGQVALDYQVKDQTL